ncbi:MAG: hypothetical protein HUU50_08600 [Candidatus Brocadiae bacterium]|nr:hypothetical protein [Candidatus Brocadiia bacterium]
MWRYLCVLIFICLSCQSNREKVQDYGDLPHVSPDSIGNVRVGLIGPYKNHNIILVNQSNQTYLQPQDFVETKNRKEVPVNALKYLGDHGSFENNTAIVIVEDDVMAKILGLFIKERFEENAEDISEAWHQKDWPERDAIFLEQDSSRMALVREEKLVDGQRPTQKSIAYSRIKYCLIQAQMAGYRPMHVLHNANASDLFKNSQNRLNQDRQKWNKK